MDLQLLLRLGRFFSFSPIHSRQESLDGVSTRHQAVTYTQVNTKIIHTQTSTHQVVFKSRTSAFEQGREFVHYTHSHCDWLLPGMLSLNISNSTCRIPKFQIKLKFPLHTTVLVLGGVVLNRVDYHFYSPPAFIPWLNYLVFI